MECVKCRKKVTRFDELGVRLERNQVIFTESEVSIFHKELLDYEELRKKYDALLAKIENNEINEKKY